MPYIRKVRNINNLIITLYGVLLFFASFYVPDHHLVPITYTTMTTGILFFFNHKMYKDNIGFRPIYHHYAFYLMVLHSIFLTNNHDSILFPVLFILPVLFVSVNFSRRESTGIAILSIVTIILILLADPMRTKLIEVIVTCLFILVLPQIVGYLIKMHLQHVRRLIKLSRQYPVE